MKPQPGTQYTTEKGDTLESIARAAYGDINEYTRLTDTNNLSFIADPSDILPIGTKIVISQDAELDNLWTQQLAAGLQ